MIVRCLIEFYITVLYSETSVSTVSQFTITELVLHAPLTEHIFHYQLYSSESNALTI